MSDGDADSESKSSCSTRIGASYESNLVSKYQSFSTSQLASSSRETDPNRSSSSSPLLTYMNYDPLSYQSCAHHTSYTSVAFFVCRSAGMGFLCMPFAFQQVGTAVGMVLCLVAGLTFTYSHTTLCHFRFKICQIRRVPIATPYYSYYDLIDHGLEWGPKAIRFYSKWIKFSFIVMNLVLNFGTSCLCMKFVSTIIQEVSAELDAPINTVDACLMFTVLFVVFMMAPSAKYLEPLSVIGQMACVVMLCYVYACEYLYSCDIFTFNERSLVRGTWTDGFQFVGILLFSFLPVAQSLKIEDELIKPKNYVKNFFGLLSKSIALVTNMYIATGFWGYLAYQHIPKIGYSVLTVMPANRWRNIAKLCTAIHITFSHRELCSETVSLWTSSVAAEAVAEAKCDDARSKCTGQESALSALANIMAATKIIFTFCSFWVVITVLSSDDRFSLERIMALIGYMGNACNLLVCPYIIEFCITHALHGMTGRPNTIIKDIFFIVFGLLLTVCGTFAIIMRIRRDNDCRDDYCKLD